ncbi:YceI family protein [Nonomuraea dietziae]|uniref:Polyisoprenoid-binding protein YceI n=1 Tax=Nonomuraea dietziae TaxID=65515 RepID=A0A7W5Y647_9ACTN|nr:YceI family protein [Nonomuraea dietziae]MBB3725733.1 polyisoprenoid-binding protein YceI [Nonomuraea dietziae]
MTAETMTTTTALPLAAGHRTLDPFHSAVGFTIRHLGISKMRGQFGHVRRHADT